MFTVDYLFNHYCNFRIHRTLFSYSYEMIYNPLKLPPHPEGRKSTHFETCI